MPGMLGAVGGGGPAEVGGWRQSLGSEAGCWHRTLGGKGSARRLGGSCVGHKPRGWEGRGRGDATCQYIKIKIKKCKTNDEVTMEIKRNKTLSEERYGDNAKQSNENTAQG